MHTQVDLYGLPLTEAKRRIGSTAQVARIDEFVETQGVSRGARRMVLTSGGGLTVDLLPDRALDIGAVSYRGVPLAWHSPTGFVAPGLSHDADTDWLRSFGGGLLATCGLDSYGPPSTDQGAEYPMHGRVGTVPAIVTRSVVTDTELIVEAEVRQAAVFGENLLLRRRITVPLGGSLIQVDDTVMNESATTAGHMVLYHANFGWPLLSDATVLDVPSASVSPRDTAAEQGLANWFDITGPVPGYAEQVFKHGFAAAEHAVVTLDNPEIDVRVAMKFDTDTLPALHQWKMLGEKHYVLGLEPTNVDWSRGRASAREAGVLPMLEPGETVKYRIEFSCGPSQRIGTAPTGGGDS